MDDDRVVEEDSNTDDGVVGRDDLRTGDLK